MQSSFHDHQPARNRADASPYNFDRMRAIFRQAYPEAGAKSVRQLPHADHAIRRVVDRWHRRTQAAVVIKRRAPCIRDRVSNRLPIEVRAT